MYIKRENAIKALPIMFNGVLITDAIKIADEFLKEHPCDELWDAVRTLRDWVECVTDEIKEYVPSADVIERKCGEWEMDWWQEGHKVRKCSYCKRSQTVNIFNGEVMFNFCPYCGADMKGNNDE